MAGNPRLLAKRMEIDNIISIVRQLAEKDQPVYLVGGAVRDRLLSRESHDLDFVLPGDTRKLARRVADALNAGFFILDAERDTSRVVFTPQDGKQFTLDFASFRASDLVSDLRARDFSINAMAFPLANETELIDPCGGLADLRSKTLRACGPTSLADDPARVLRAVRLGVELGYQLDDQTYDQARSAAGLLPNISQERQRDELVRMLEGKQTSQCIKLLERLGGLEYVFPETIPIKGVLQPAPHVHDVWEHTLEVLDHLEDLVGILTGTNNEESASNLILSSAVEWLGRYREQFARHLAQTMPNGRSLVGVIKLAALYHDTGKATTGSLDADGNLHFLGHEDVSARLISQRARHLAYSNEEVERCVMIVREHMRLHHLSQAPNPPTPRAIYRYFRDTGDAGIDIGLLSLADTWATYSNTLPQERWLKEIQTYRALLEARWEKTEAVISPPRLLDGRDLMDTFKLAPGQIIGLMLEAIREGQAGGEINTKDEALAFAENWLSNQKEGSDGESKR